MNYLLNLCFPFHSLYVLYPKELGENQVQYKTIILFDKYSSIVIDGYLALIML